MLPKWPSIRQYSDHDRPDGTSREEWGVHCANELEYAIHYAGEKTVAAFLANMVLARLISTDQIATGALSARSVTAMTFSLLWTRS